MKRTILALMDVAAPTRATVNRALKPADFDVIWAANASAAVDLSTRHHIDLLLLDLSQPLRTGCKIFERLRTLHADVPVVILTEHKAGYGQAVADRPGVVLRKPFNVAGLAHAVHSLLGLPSPNDALPAKQDEGFREGTTESDDFREKLLRGYTAPYQLPSPHRQWGINE